MKKAEMELHATEYRTRVATARTAAEQGFYRTALDLAFSSCDHIDGMMQYARKHQDRELVTIEAIELILKYAPLLLDAQSIERLADLLKSQRRIEKYTSKNLADKLAQAKRSMWDAHRLWDHLEQDADARQDNLRRILGADQTDWRALAEAWDRMGLLRRTPEGQSYRLALITRLGEVVSAKCPSCGGVTQAPKAMLLEPLRCPHCHVSALFVFLTIDPASGTTE